MFYALRITNQVTGAATETLYATMKQATDAADDYILRASTDDVRENMLIEIEEVIRPCATCGQGDRRDDSVKLYRSGPYHQECLLGRKG